ncbi:Holliday junction branch migration protein RuvA [Candidatus Anaplasma sp. TIGMIC]|uniref:Holliday junction branch migration protein RuvA n=1 Tax=Candidatus Anaplasma sp. TIGMIC TaxID=3020713 RepID=UPI00232CB222|nr:Holliday junction branch migration protein RuvA [Candidatus Anaplasma sp. TIGMIC]MDB1135145.1 Holliday junction branch migration protein RuvA [Candidatus Anaplasma sp. TIGMIC]
MIGTLSGIVEEILDNGIILSVGGVGYIVHISYRTLLRCKRGDMKKLYIETYVNRENVPQLYGFDNTAEQQCLRMLIKVSGINYKTALSILDRLTPDQLFSAIVNEDKAALKVGGIGDKLTNRIFTELTPIIQKLEFNPTLAKRSPHAEENDAISALLGLGYEKTRILDALGKVGTTHSLSDTVRYALKELTK